MLLAVVTVWRRTIGISLRRISFAAGGLILCVLLLAAPTVAQRPALVSMKAAGSTGGSSDSLSASVSANGRFVAFSSSARDLVALNITQGPNIYVRDLQTGVTTLVSMNSLGNDGGNGTSLNPVISADGRYVAFQSSANNLSANDTNRSTDIFVRDLQTGITALASPNQSRTDGGNRESINPYISANGQVVTFESAATNLVANDTNNHSDIFAYDLRTGVTSLVSVNLAGNGSGNDDSSRADSDLSLPFHHHQNAISDDGRYTVFESRATDLTAAQDNNSNLSDKEDVFVRDLQTGTTIPVSVNLTGDGTGNGYSFGPTISGDGKYVAFVSSSSNLAANKRSRDIRDIFVRHLVAGSTTLVSVSTSGGDGGYHSDTPSISADGRYIAFASQAGDLVPVDTNRGAILFSDVFVRDMQSGTTRLVSLNSAGTDSGDDVSYNPVINATGRFVAFISNARDLVQSVPKFPNTKDIYVWDLQSATTNMLSVAPDGTHSSSGFNERPAISADGRIVVFDSSNLNLIPEEPPGSFSKYNVFAVAVNGQAKFSSNIYSVNETDGTATVTISRNNEQRAPLTVSYTTTNGSATAGRDYTQTSGTLTYAVGETSKTLTVPILDDRIDEANETINFILANLNTSGAPAVLSMTAVKILDDDPPPTISINDVSVIEGNAGSSAAVFTLTLSTLTEQEVSVDVSTQFGTAASFADVQPVSGKRTIAPGQVSQTMTVSVFGENVFEADETFTLNLSNPVNVNIADGQGVGTIINDDPIPAISIFNTSVLEGTGGTRNLVISLSLSNASYQQVQAQYATADGTATAGSDYVAADGTVSFNPGEVNAFITIAVNGDTLIEPNETFFVNLANPLNAMITNGQGMGTIVNDDGPNARFSATNYIVNEGVGQVILTITRSGDPSAFTIDYATLDRDTFTVGCADAVNNGGGAYGRCDFATTVGTLSFAAGENSKTLNVPLINDAHVEGAETFQVRLSNVIVAGITLGTQNIATVTIQDNDGAGAVNPIITLSASDYAFFVRQQYLDFLSREPEPNEPWTAVMNRCANVNTGPATNTDCDRLAVSGAFFGSPEFRVKGFYVFRFYKVAFHRLPQYPELVADMSFVAGQTEAEVYARKAHLATMFVARQEFTNAYGGQSNAEYVAALLSPYQLSTVTTPDPAAPDGAGKVSWSAAALTNGLDAGTLTRAQALRAVADSDEVGARESTSAFVAVQYYGYLRRTPDDNGYQAWLRVINQDPHNVRIMVNGFLNSTEYRLRFGPP
jgi:hypothetical protein